jgi:phage shock protein PspC (stress-responsive transcriptional regulator)
MSERPPEASPGEQAPSPATASSTAQPPPPIEPSPAAPGPEPAPGPVPGTPAGPVPGAVRRLTRRADRRMIAGVAGGIADYLGIEAWVVRLGFIVLVPFGGFGLLAYLIAWLLVPVAGSDQSLASAVLRRPPSGLRSYIGAGLILLAVAILASAFSEPSVIWAIALIAFGIFLFRQDDLDPPDRRPPTGGGGPGPAAGAAPLPAVPPAPTTTATTEPLAPPPVSDRGTNTLPPDVPVW